MNTYFRVVDNNTKEELAVLPTTIPIGTILDGFSQAGYQVSWSWEWKNKEDLS
jgi:hypothetical protein